MKTHLAPTESLTVVIDDKEITVTAQQLLAMKQPETTDPDEKYRELCNDLIPTFHTAGMVLSELSHRRVRTYIKMLNIAAKLNGDADWFGDGYSFHSFLGEIQIVRQQMNYPSGLLQFRTEALAIEALTYLNSEDKIAMFGTEKVNED